mmetsp:Transcript_13565/g.15243  ORF Transcript_13565/g.15243 Transcript_13565/m.15243 type:complete len:83 (+) Transcript_13565:568-816(+)
MEKKEVFERYEIQFKELKTLFLRFAFFDEYTLLKKVKNQANIKLFHLCFQTYLLSTNLTTLRTFFILDLRYGTSIFVGILIA